MLRGAEETGDAVGVREDVLGVLGLGDRAAVAEDDDVRADADGRRRASPGRARADSSSVSAVLAPIDPLVVRPRCGDEHVGAGLGHRPGLVGVEDVGAGQQVELGGPRAIISTSRS